MDDELFDDELDEICTQVPNDLAVIENEPIKDEFKKPEAPKKPSYSINRVQNRPTQQPFSVNQQKSTQNEINRPNTFDQIKLNQNDSNQKTIEADKFNLLNNQLNRLNQPLKPNRLNKQINLNQPNNRSNAFTKPLTSVNQSTINRPSTSSGGISNLAKSMIAQNQACKYSVNKQILISNQNNQQSFVQPTKQINANVSKNSTIRSSQSSSQTSVILSTQQSPTANHSSFEISDNVTAGLHVKPTLKTLDVGPEDKYVGEIQMLKTQLKRKDEKIGQLEGLISEKEKEVAEKMKDYLRMIEKLTSEREFDSSRTISEGFRETLCTQVIQISPNLSRNVSKTTLRLPSPKKQQKHQPSNESVRVPSFNINNMSLDDDNFMIPETQPIPCHQNQNTTYLSDTAPTRIDTKRLARPDSIIEESDEEDIVPATQICDMFIPETQAPSPKKNVEAVNEREEASVQELKRIKIEPIEPVHSTQDQPVVCHELRFKFVDFQVFDNLLLEKRMNYIRENINPDFDKIVEKIINLQLYNQLSEYEFKFCKLDETFVLALLYLDFETNIPELVFNLLTNMHKYTTYLQDNELLFKLTNRCLIIDEQSNNRYADGQTLLNRMAIVFSSFQFSDDPQLTNNYLRLCHSIVIFLNENTVEKNNISEFHAPKGCNCWSELYDALGQFALYLLEIYDAENKLHELIVVDLTKFILNLDRSKIPVKEMVNFPRFSHFVQKMPDVGYSEHLSSMYVRTL